MSSLELFPISQLIYLKLQHTVAKPAEHSDGKRGDSITCAEPAECMGRIGQNSRVRVADEQTQPRRIATGRNPIPIKYSRLGRNRDSSRLCTAPAARPPSQEGRAAGAGQSEDAIVSTIFFSTHPPSRRLHDRTNVSWESLVNNAVRSRVGVVIVGFVRTSTRLSRGVVWSATEKTIRR